MLFLLPSFIIFICLHGALSREVALRFQQRESDDTNLGHVNYTCATPGVYPHEIHCELYYNCGPDYTILFHCRADLLFDLRYNGCNYKEYVNCGNRTRPGEVPPTTPIPHPTTTTINDNPCTEQNGNLPDPVRYCTSSYYICINYTPYPETCPGGNIFDPVTRKCANPANSTCNALTTEAPSKCPSTNGFFPNRSQQCSGQFYTCVGGIAYETLCPGRGIFDSHQLVCVPQNTANCSEPTTTRPNITTSTTRTPETVTHTTIGIMTSTESRPFTCPGPGYYPDPNNCSQYYHCDPYGVAILQKCAAPLVFNPATGHCDWQANVPGCSIYE